MHRFPPDLPGAMPGFRLTCSPERSSGVARMASPPPPGCRQSGRLSAEQAPPAPPPLGTPHHTYREAATAQREGVVTPHSGWIAQIATACLVRTPAIKSLGSGLHFCHAVFGPYNRLMYRLVLTDDDDFADAMARLAAMSPAARRLLAQCIEAQGLPRSKLSPSALRLEEEGFIRVREHRCGTFDLLPTLAGEEAMERLDTPAPARNAGNPAEAMPVGGDRSSPPTTPAKQAGADGS